MDKNGTSEIKDPVFIKFVKSLFEDRKDGNHSDAINIGEYNREIEEAEKEIEAGNFYTSKEVKEIMQEY